MQKYNCKTCGAELYWDAASGSLKCQYCDSVFQISDFADKSVEKTYEQIVQKATGIKEEPAPEPTQADENATATDDSELTADLVVYQCEHCGAEVITARSTIATTCAFCGRAISLTDKIVGNFRPELVIPFTVQEEEAVKAYKKYCHKSKLLPKRFLEESQIKKIKGVYVPYWLHSFDSSADVSASCENHSSRRRGDDKIVTHKKYSVTMDVNARFDQVPTDGLKHLDNALVSKIEPYDYKKLAKFNPVYMAGFYAEEHGETKEEGLKRAKERTEEAIKETARGRIARYDTHHIDTCNIKVSNEKSKYAMMPMWLISVDYKDEINLFAINGETGKVAGNLPICPKKLAAYSVCTFAASYAVAIIVQLLMTWA